MFKCINGTWLTEKGIINALTKQKYLKSGNNITKNWIYNNQYFCISYSIIKNWDEKGGFQETAGFKIKNCSEDVQKCVHDLMLWTNFNFWYWG